MLIALLVLLAVLVSAPAASAELAPGPHLASVALIEREGYPSNLDPEPSVALAVIDPATGREKRLLRGPLEVKGGIVPSPFNPPAWSADGGLIAFNAASGGEGDRGRIYVVAADGSGLRPIPRAINGVNPVFSADGRMLAFARSRFKFHFDRKHILEPWKSRSWTYWSTSTWIVDLAGGKPRRLTPWENGLDNTPTSFSPDGSSLLLTRRDGRRDGPRVMRMSLADGTTRELLVRAQEAVYSPDGTRLAFTGFLHPDLVEADEDPYLAEELYVADADGTRVRRLSHSKGIVETAPSWDPSGQRLAYVRWRGDTSFISGLASLFPVGNTVMQVNADGSCRQKIATLRSVAFYGAVWQPGPGREAGALVC